MADGGALAAMEARAVREKRRATFSAALGCGSGFLSAALWLALPPLWRVLNGEWSARVLPSLAALAAHGVMVVAAVVALRCAQVQGGELLDEFYAKYLSTPLRGDAGDGVAAVDRAAALNNLLKSLGTISPVKKAGGGGGAAVDEDALAQRSFFDPPAVKTVEDGRAYLRRLQNAQKAREADAAMQSSASAATAASQFSMAAGGTFATDAFGIYGNPAALAPRVYQASGFDPYMRDLTVDQEEDPLRTSSHPQAAWKQLEDLNLDMFIHLYCRNIRRLLAFHVKDVVEAFVQNANELNACGVMVDLLLRRVPTQALLCPPGQTNTQMTNVSLSDMLHAFARSPLFESKERGVFLFEEHRSFEKYLNVGDPSSTDYSSLERQQYVLERLFMLSKDRSLDRYRWNKGSAWKGKEWSDNLPTDAEILMNTFCCMMDNMLPADNERDRPFWKSYYFSKGPNRPFTPRVRSRLFVVQTVSRPPHFKVLTKGAVREIMPGEDNIFHAIVVYMNDIKKKKAGYLESINLHRIIEQVFDVVK